MRYFDPHIHMVSRTTDDYENMAAAGVLGVVEPAFWQGQPRTNPGTFVDYFDMLVGWERFRASQFGIRHYCTMGMNPKESNDVELAEAVMKLLPRYCQKDGVVAVGEIGYDDMTATEERFLAEQIELAMAVDLPVLIHTPHRDKKR
ncbi:MAG: TatD family hydrolase, partial [Pseudomonadota bacterium]